MTTWQTLVQVRLALAVCHPYCFPPRRSAVPLQLFAERSPSCFAFRNRQVGKRAADVPPVLRVFFSTISILQLDVGSVLHPACYSGSPFTTEYNQFLASIVSTLIMMGASRLCGCFLV